MTIASDISHLIRRHIAKAIAGLYTNEIAQVVAFDKATLLVSVQPCVTRFRSADAGKLTGIRVPILNDVSLKLPGSGQTFLSVSPQVGSYGALHFSDRCIEQWVQDGGIAPPRSARKLDLNDCWFDPGLYPQAADGDNGAIAGGIEDDRISLRTREGDAEISVVDNDTLHMTTNGADLAVSAAGDFVFNKGAGTAIEYARMKVAFDALLASFNAHIAAFTLHTHSGGGSGAPVTPGVPSTADMTAAESDKIIIP